MFFPATWFVRDSAWQLGVTMAAVLVFIGALAAIAPAVYPQPFLTSAGTIGVAVPCSLCDAVRWHSRLRAGRNGRLGRRCGQPLLRRLHDHPAPGHRRHCGAAARNRGMDLSSV
jgi:hypothetical protein